MVKYSSVEENSDESVIVRFEQVNDSEFIYVERAI